MVLFQLAPALELKTMQSYLKLKLLGGPYHCKHLEHLRNIRGTKDLHVDESVSGQEIAMFVLRQGQANPLLTFPVILDPATRKIHEQR